MPDLLGRIIGGLAAARPGWMAIGCGLLLIGTLWFGAKAWRSHSFMAAIRSAPAIRVDSADGILVKVAGDAASVAGNASILWSDRTSTTYQGQGNSGTRTYSVEPFVIHGAETCVIRPDARTEVVPTEEATTRSDSFLSTNASRAAGRGSSTYTTERELRAGPAFAIGVLWRDPASRECELRAPRFGALLVSGKTEVQTLRRYGLRLALHAGAALVLLIVIAGSFAAHLLAYPNRSPGEFLAALRTDPWLKQLQTEQAAHMQANTGCSALFDVVDELLASEALSVDRIEEVLGVQLVQDTESDEYFATWRAQDGAAGVRSVELRVPGPSSTRADGLLILNLDCEKALHAGDVRAHFGATPAPPIANPHAPSSQPVYDVYHQDWGKLSFGYSSDADAPLVCIVIDREKKRL